MRMNCVLRVLLVHEVITVLNRFPSLKRLGTVCFCFSLSLYHTLLMLCYGCRHPHFHGCIVGQHLHVCSTNDLPQCKREGGGRSWGWPDGWMITDS